MNRIRELRTARGWRQLDLAELLNTSPQAIGNYESEYRGMDVETIRRLCDIFEVSADYLLCRSQQPGSPITDEEWEIIEAFRNADEDARAMVKLALKRYTGEKIKGEVS